MTYVDWGGTRYHLVSPRHSGRIRCGRRIAGRKGVKVLGTDEALRKNVPGWKKLCGGCRISEERSLRVVR